MIKGKKHTVFPTAVHKTQETQLHVRHENREMSLFPMIYSQTFNSVQHSLSINVYKAAACFGPVQGQVTEGNFIE